MYLYLFEIHGFVEMSRDVDVGDCVGFGLLLLRLGLVVYLMILGMLGMIVMVDYLVLGLMMAYSSSFWNCVWLC